ncbi:MAG: hypothetical protein GF355_05200 [Candidatus Eisenbacteria bacterium]|nr:hypothetical protein [Candidatus Eisenbacteria bacterium]
MGGELVRLERWLLWLGRIVLAAIFAYAAVGKLADPQGFARALWNYRMFPDAVIPYMALGVPALELVVAAGILLPPLQRGASLIYLLLLVAFIISLGSAMARRLDVDCGCFGEGSSSVGPLLIVRNVALAAVAVWSYIRAGVK